MVEIGGALEATEANWQKPVADFEFQHLPEKKTGEWKLKIHVLRASSITAEDRRGKNWKTARMRSKMGFLPPEKIAQTSEKNFAHNLVIIIVA